MNGWMNEDGVIMPVPVVVVVVVVVVAAAAVAAALTVTMTMMKHVRTQYYDITLSNLSV